MSTFLPQLQIENVWSDNLPRKRTESKLIKINDRFGRRYLLIASLPVLLADEVAELVIDASAVWHPETAAGRQLVEEEQLLLRS